MSIGFYVEMEAPNGLADVRLTQCTMGLQTHTSAHNGKVILRSELFNEALQWDMASSDTDVMYAEGKLAAPLDEAIAHIQTLSRCLVRADVPHMVLIDDEAERLAMRIEYRWHEA